MSDLELFLDLDNRRHDKRYRMDLPLLAGGRKAKLVNVSRSGIRFLADSKQEADEIELILGGRLRLKGKRVWSREVGPGHKMLGVHFSDAVDLLMFRSWLGRVEEKVAA
jgi:hypothetical protein